MADLIALYDGHGLEMTAGELPDFLPLFLEFLSLLPDTEARAMLAEPAGILRALADRLAARDTAYATVMEALAGLAQAPAVGRSEIPDEDPDDLVALDAAWEEAAVRFGTRRDDGWMQHRPAADAAACVRARCQGSSLRRHDDVAEQCPVSAGIPTWR